MYMKVVGFFLTLSLASLSWQVSYFFPLKAIVVQDTVKKEWVGNSKPKPHILADRCGLPNPIRKSKH